MEMIKGDKGDQDISFDSNFKLGIMDELRNSTRSTYRSIGLVDKDIIYLVMDNAGGHGENEAMLEYSEYLEENYNIVVHPRFPWSHETNMIDPGAWMTMQSKVEIFHLRNVKQHDALARSTNKAWCNVEEQKLTIIWERFLKVLDLIIQVQGGNELVEIKRGLAFFPEENVENEK